MSQIKDIIIFDFDKTLYKKDILIEFWIYTLKKYPKKLWVIVIQIIAALLHFLKIIDTKSFKQHFLIYLNNIDEPNLEILINDFWARKSESEFHQELLDIINKREYRIICISASPELFLKPIMDKYKLEYIGTKIKYLGNKYKIEGENCKGIEKVNRLSTYLNHEPYKIKQVYSDSMTDLPLFKLCKEPYFMNKKGEIERLVLN